YIGDGSSWTNLGDLPRTLQANLRTIQVFAASGQQVRFFRNLSLVATKTHSKAASTQSVFQIGKYTGHLAEVLLYPALSDTSRTSVYDSVNAYFATGPSGVNQQALLPQDWQ